MKKIFVTIVALLLSSGLSFSQDVLSELLADGLAVVEAPTLSDSDMDKFHKLYKGMGMRKIRAENSNSSWYMAKKPMSSKNELLPYIFVSKYGNLEFQVELVKKGKWIHAHTIEFDIEMADGRTALLTLVSNIDTEIGHAGVSDVIIKIETASKIPLADHQIKMIKAVTQSDKTIVRFVGRKGSSSFELNERQVNMFRTTLAAFEKGNKLLESINNK